MHSSALTKVNKKEDNNCDENDKNVNKTAVNISPTNEEETITL